MAFPSDFTFTRHTLSKYFPDVHKRSYIEGTRLSVTSSPVTSNLNFTYNAILRKISVVSSGSFDGDYINISGSNRPDPYALNIYTPSNGLGLVLTFELGENFTGSQNNIYVSFFPAGSTANTIYVYHHFIRD